MDIAFIMNFLGSQDINENTIKTLGMLLVLMWMKKEFHSEKATIFSDAIEEMDNDELKTLIAKKMDNNPAFKKLVHKELQKKYPKKKVKKTSRKARMSV